MEKYIDSIEELNLGQRVAGGNCSNIYLFNEGHYFKSFNEDYRDLNDPINVEFYETIKYLSNLSGMPFVVRGKDIYRSKNELFGYSMPIILAGQLYDADEHVLIDDFLNSLGLLSDDIRKLANSYVKTEDIGGDNILYNGNMYLLDLDLSLVDKLYIPDELYERTLHSVLCAVRGKMLGDERCSDVVKDGDYLTYFSRIRDICCDKVGSDVKTIGEFKRSYQKVDKRYFD